MKLIIANWKSNPLDIASAIDLAQKTDKKGVVIAPPFQFIPEVANSLKSASLGAQDVFWEDVGPYTGEVSWHQLQIMGVKYVIAGHSERRKYLGETDAMVNKKVLSALKNGFIVILCVGESSEIRKNGLNAAKAFVANQLQKGLIGSDPALFKNLIIAYEPVWAIGTGSPDSPESVSEMAEFIKLTLRTTHKAEVSVIYGGSVNSNNAKSFLSRVELDGALVGGASLKPEEFNAIVNAAK